MRKILVLCGARILLCGARISLCGALVAAVFMVTSCPSPVSNAKNPGGKTAEEVLPRLTGLYVLDTSSVPASNIFARFNSEDEDTGPEDENEDEDEEPPEDTDPVPPGTPLVLRDADGNPVDFQPETLVYYVEIPQNPITITLHGKVNKDEGEEAGYPTGRIITPRAGTVSLVTIKNAEAALECYQVFYTQAALPQASIDSVLLSAGTLRTAFSSAVRDYDVDIPGNADEFIIYARSALSGAVFGYDPALPLPLTGNSATLNVTVTAPGYTPAVYTFKITRASGTVPSALAGFTLTDGGFEGGNAFDPAAATAQTITLPPGTQAFTAVAVKANPADTVQFAYSVANGSLVESAGAACSFQRAGGFSGFTFSATVTGAAANAAPKTYDFTVTEGAAQPARLTGLTVSAGQATLYQRNAATGANGGAGFVDSKTFYNMNFDGGASGVALEISAETGAEVSIDDVIAVPSGSGGGSNQFTKTVGTPQAKSPPIKITVSKSGLLSSSYYVYCVRANKTPARLTGITVDGMAGSLNPAFSETDIGPYTAKITANTPAVVITGAYNAAAHPALTVSYKNLSTGSTSNFLANLTAGTNVNVEITISEGDPDADYDYERTVYTVSVQPQTAQVPRLSSLTVDTAPVTPAVTGKTHDTLVYAAALPYGGGMAVVPAFAWNVDSEIEKVWYSFDDGAMWHQDTNKTGFDAAELSMASAPANTWSIAPSESKLVLIKVRTFDGQEAVYYVRVNRAGNPAARLSSLSVKETGGTTEYLAAFNADVFAYTVTVPDTVANVTISADKMPNTGVFMAKNGAPMPAAENLTLALTSLLHGGTQTAAVMVKPQEQSSAWNTYTLQITRAEFTSSDLDALEVSGTGINWVTGTTFNKAKTAYNVWLTGAADALATDGTLTIDTVTPSAQDAVVFYELDGGAPALTNPSPVTVTLGQPKTLKIAVVGSSSVKTYTLTITYYKREWEYAYEGSGKPWTAPRDSNYKFEVWGGQGGAGVGQGGKGGYSWGIKNGLASGSQMTVYVGNKGNDKSGKTGGAGGWGGTNGGNGGTTVGTSLTGAGGGGGASDIRSGGGTDAADRIIVAGGGGGGCGRNSNDNEKRVGVGGGGPRGNGGSACKSVGTPDTEISGAKWATDVTANPNHSAGQSSGTGENGFGGINSGGKAYEGSGGGGGGYWGGNASPTNSGTNFLAGGAGGSGYVDTAFFSASGGSGGFTTVGGDATAADTDTGYGNYADCNTGAGRIRITDMLFTPPAP